MILVVDIGNTTVSFGGIEISDRNEYRVDFTTKLDTNCTWDTADYTVRLLKKLHLLGKEREEFSGIAQGPGCDPGGPEFDFWPGASGCHL